MTANEIFVGALIVWGIGAWVIARERQILPGSCVIVTILLHAIWAVFLYAVSITIWAVLRVFS